MGNIPQPNSRAGLHDTSNVSLHTDRYRLIVYDVDAASGDGNGVGSILFSRLSTGGKVISIEFPEGASAVEKILLIQTSLALERRVNFLLVYQNITLHWIMWRLLPGVILVLFCVYLVPNLQEV